MDKFKRNQLSVFATIFFGYAIFAYNRKCVSFAIPKLLSHGLERDQVGLIASSQNLAYAISKFFGGVLSDKISSRILFSSGLLLAGVATLLFSTSSTITMFTLFWFMNGLAQGAGWPSIAKLLKNWFSPSELGTWWSIASASANLSGCIAPFIASYLILNYDWRFSLVFVGTLSVMAAVSSFIFLIDSPTDIGLKSFDTSSVATKSESQSKRSPSNKKEDKQPLMKSDVKRGKTDNPLYELLRSPFIWVISLCYLTISCLKTSVTDWAQLYLVDDCQQPSLVASSFVSSVEFGGFFGGIAAGYLSDLYMKRSLGPSGKLQSRGHPRMAVALMMAVVTGVCLHLMYFYVNKSTSPVFINMLGAMIGASIYGDIAIFGVVATQSVMSEISGTAHAIAALAANIGSIVAGLPFATIAKHNSWSLVFFILEMMSLVTIGFMILTHRVSYSMSSVKKNN